MATYNISKIALPSGDECCLQTGSALDSRTYTDVIATADNAQGGGFFCLAVHPDTWAGVWHVKVRITATVPSNANYRTVTESDIWGTEAAYLAYRNKNIIKSTSYRPIYYVSLFRTNSVGYTNSCSHWLGFSLTKATNPTDTSLKRTVVVELIEYEGCTAALENSLITPDNIPNRSAHTDWYTSTNTSFDNFDAYANGIRFTGDQNTTTISNLYYGDEIFIAKNAIYRYQLLFTVTGNIVTPLNTNNNDTGASKTMLTNEEFDPLGPIYYYNSTTTRAQNASFNGGTGFLYSCGVFDLRYTFNISNDGSRTAGAMTYLKVLQTTNGLCKIASATPLTQTLPNSEDGYLYIELGKQYDWYRCTLHPEKPVYYYKNGKVMRYTGDSVNVANADTVNGHTVAEDVPADAVFTDTTYSSLPAALKGTDVSLVTTGEKYNWNGLNFIASKSGVTSVTLTVPNSSRHLLLGTTTNPSTSAFAVFVGSNGSGTVNYLEIAKGSILSFSKGTNQFTVTSSSSINITFWEVLMSGSAMSASAS